METFDLVEVVPSAAARGKAKVDTKWEIIWRGGKLKCRLYGREFKWSVDRDDVFAPSTSGLTSRVIDYVAMKLGCEVANDPDSNANGEDDVVCFVVDALQPSIRRQSGRNSTQTQPRSGWRRGRPQGRTWMSCGS